MKKYFTILLASLLVIGAGVKAIAQENADAAETEEQVNTIFKSGHLRSSGYGAISNKFTTIDGEFANMVEVYGGWFVNRKLLIGVGGAATTNEIRVREQYSAIPGVKMSYQYVQFGLHTEYVVASNKAMHVVFHLFAGPGLTAQYERDNWYDDEDDHNDPIHETNWFMVAEPGIQVEFNVLKWMRFSPGISYRYAYGSDAAGLKDSDISGTSVNLTLKFGKF